MDNSEPLKTEETIQNEVQSFLYLLDLTYTKTSHINEAIEKITSSHEDKKIIILDRKYGTGRLTITQYIMALLRCHNLLPNQRNLLLPLQDQINAIQLCLARLNKKRFDDFGAVASDVMDIWNSLLSDMLKEKVKEKEDNIDLDLSSLRNQRDDPVVRELKENINAYKEFLKSSSMIDHFELGHILKNEFHNKETLLKDTLSKQVLIVTSFHECHIVEKKLFNFFVKEGKLNICSYSNNEIRLNLTETIPDELFKDHPIIPLDVNSPKPKVIGQIGALNSKQTLPSKSNSPASKSVNNCDSPSKNAVNVDNHDSPTCKNPQSSNTSAIKTPTNSNSSIIKTPKSSKSPARSPNRKGRQQTINYLEKLIYAHIRLLINSRDELSLAVALAMPGREISQEAFADIKEAAQKINMPLYQTLMSFVMKRRLGGESYQPDPDCAILLHEKPLSEFVNFMFKLQNIIEEEMDPRKATMKTLNAIKTGICTMKGNVLKRNLMEQATELVKEKMQQILDSTAYKTVEEFTQKFKNPLPKSLSLFQKLCDTCGGEGWDYKITDTITSEILNQGTPTLSQSSKTPIQIPTVLSLFKSPLENKKVTNNDGLLNRVLKQKSQKNHSKSDRQMSHCSWADNSSSPVTSKVAREASSPFSPIYGPTLQAIGDETKRLNNTNWQEMVQSVVEYEENEKAKERAALIKPTKKTKRSLLVDITNVENQEIKAKKMKSSPKKEKPKNKSKLKPLPSDQKQITSFFKK